MNRMMKLVMIFLGVFVGYAVPDVQGQDTRHSRLERKAMRRSGFIGEMFSEWKHTGGMNIDSIRIDSDSMLIRYYLNPTASQMPVRPSTIAEINGRIRVELGNRFRKYQSQLFIKDRLMEDYIPNAYRQNSYIPDAMRFSEKYGGFPLVTPEFPNYPKGIQVNHIALWPSHGYFFDQQLNRWQWQRARLWQTVEDIFSWSFTSNYLIPMLENAGANVLIPRERDTQINEVVVDNDGSYPSGKIVINVVWDTLNTGFKWFDTLYPGQNPFLSGSSLYFQSVYTDTARITYIPDIPETGCYAVYVSYPHCDNCSDHVHYQVKYSGGSRSFYVNQCMGYGTWVYLGTFHFKEGSDMESASVTLEAGRLSATVGSDAVKFGGGVGNVARKPGFQQVARQRSANDGTVQAGTLETDTIAYSWTISGKPRWMEGSRYYLQYAGMPDTITYSLNAGKNDYNDDYMSRPEWVNFLIGSSRKQYSGKYAAGKNIPVDLSLAFHTDAGVTDNDSVIGTLGIYSTTRNNGIFPDGRSKMSSRYLTDMVQTQLTEDIRDLLNPEWTRRALWDREYSEAWRPVVPSMLLELLSHQNLADMKYGLDPRFKFIAARAVYKGILKYLGEEQNREVVVQPLPPAYMAIEVVDGKTIRVSWKPTEDRLEPSASPLGYHVYCRTEDNGFAPPLYTTSQSLTWELPQWNTIYSFRVTAVNEGGESLPGETLSVSVSPGSDPVLIINAFDRISAPAFFDKGDMAGIAWWKDEGVAYMTDLSFTGYQYNFDRNSEWIHDDSQGWGASQADMETIPVAGNTFDFPFIHGNAIRNSGRSFVSLSDEAFVDPGFNTDRYRVADVIFGEERRTDNFTFNGNDYKVFSSDMIRALTAFARPGKGIFISGAYVGTDMTEQNDSAAINFAADILHYIWRTGHATAKGDVVPTSQGREWFPQQIAFNTEFGKHVYRVESPDAIEPVGNDAFRLCRYLSGGTSAGVAYNGEYRSVVLGFPFETITSEESRNEVMKKILDFLTSTLEP